MYSLKVKKEFLYDQETIKIVVDKQVRDVTTRQGATVYGQQGDKELYLKALLLKTNKLEAPKDYGVYNLTWRQNYLFVGLLMAAITYYAFKVLLADGHYETSERIILLFVGGAIVKLVWNDLLILGRKIRIEKEEI